MSGGEKSALRGEPGHVWRSGQERRLEMISRWTDLSGRILDNGCGLGTYLDAFGRYSRQRYGVEVEIERAIISSSYAEGVVQGFGEYLPFADGTFDVVLSNEVIEHVADDVSVVAEMVRVTAPGGRVIVFCPNRWYPVEQHGIYWKGEYHFGNIPLVNYFPNSIRERLAPHVRTYSRSALFQLIENLPVKVVHYGRIFGGYDNIEARWNRFGRALKRALYAAEKTPLAFFGISHLLVVEKV